MMRPTILDGAMGTELIRRGYVGPTWQANLDAPELVRAIHADYVAAGAEAILTNTFLAPERDERQAFLSAIRSAREAAKAQAVYLSLGPRRTTVDFPDPGFLDGIFVHRPHVDGVMLETCSDASAFDVVRRIRDAWPILRVIVSFTYRGDPPMTFSGRTPEEVGAAAEKAGVDMLGVNCGAEQSPPLVRRVLKGYRQVTNRPLAARPNAGSPDQTTNAELWAAEVSRLTEAALLGGCCGTTPEHIRSLATRLTR
jgi:methionine synthase I (cobalamin-dependent)